MSNNGIKIEAITGKARPLVIIYEQDGRFEQLAGEFASLLPAKQNYAILSVAPFSEYEWQDRAFDLSRGIIENKLKNFCIIGFGSTCSLVIHLYLQQAKLVRSMVLIDGTTRPHPSRLTRIIDRIENYLPAGLPFRSNQRTFNASPFLQRIRCPSAIVTTELASSYHLAEAETFKTLLPTAWTMQTTNPISAENSAEQLANFILDFQNVAAKRPQKNVNLASMIVSRD